MDISKLSSGMIIQAYYSKEAGNNFEVLYNGNWINLKRVTSFWWRRPQPIRINQRVTNMEHIEFAKKEWEAALYGIWMSTSEKLWVNDISNEFRASKKPYQLYVAKQIGLNIPETLITNNPDQVIELWKKHYGKIIFKPFFNSVNEWRETRPLKKEFLSKISNLKFAPCIFQEYIDNSKDIRVTIIGNNVIAATNATDYDYKYDWRMTNVKWVKHSLPRGVHSTLLRYMRSLGLEYGAIDMKLASDGRYYFLEINPQGQFLFIEKNTHLNIAHKLILHLLEGIKTRTP